jgi:hypothetical protein
VAAAVSFALSLFMSSFSVDDVVVLCAAAAAAATAAAAAAAVAARLLVRVTFLTVLARLVLGSVLGEFAVALVASGILFSLSLFPILLLFSFFFFKRIYFFLYFNL